MMEAWLGSWQRSLLAFGQRPKPLDSIIAETQPRQITIFTYTGSFLLRHLQCVSSVALCRLICQCAALTV